MIMMLLGALNPNICIKSDLATKQPNRLCKPLDKRLGLSMSRKIKINKAKKNRKKKRPTLPIRKVQFFANLDDTHCFQASIRMILKYFNPSDNYDWNELDKLSGKKEGLWTWPLYAMVKLEENGFDVVNIEDFDYDRFSKEGEPYVMERFGPEVGAAQIKNSDIAYEMKNAELFLKRCQFEPRMPDLQDIENLLKNGYLLICNVNSCALNDIHGYCGHFVVVYDINNKYLTLHDPGLPPHESRRVARNKFIRSWAYPTEKEKNVMAIRYRKRIK